MYPIEKLRVGTKHCNWLDTRVTKRNTWIMKFCSRAIKGNHNHSAIARVC
uniref:Uncharacterized protein n=1 Tax=Anguilla anguilla TaxID=7936 RepID=A0A0E9XDL0_ANGAN